MAPLRFVSRFLTAIVSLLLLAAAAGLWSFKVLEAAPAGGAVDALPRTEDGGYVFSVSAGESAAAVGARLSDSGLIRSPLLWNLVARVDSEKIKTGSYSLRPTAGMLEIREVLVSGRQILVRVTVPEGFTLRKTAELLEARGIVDADSFLAAATDEAFVRGLGIPARSAEGYLFPDTYLFPKDYEARQAVKAMVRTFFSRLDSILPEAFRTSTDEELYDRLILASIVEREYRVADEAPLMAGVFLNRLRIGMALQSCATVEYVITEIQGKPHPDVLYNRDIAIQDPFNTYIKPGLPPGPISSPGLVALEAAFKPQASDYLYFRLVDPAEGRHRFSRSFDDHIQAGVIYLKATKAGS